jgi:hypothetical protein
MGGGGSSSLLSWVSQRCKSVSEVNSSLYDCAGAA